MREKVKITGTQYKESKAGNRMIALTLETPAGERLYHYITFIPDKPDVTNRMLDNFFKSFDIKAGNFKFSDWLGMEAEAELVDEEWNGRTYKKVKYFIVKKFQPSPEIQKVLEKIAPQQEDKEIKKEEQKEISEKNEADQDSFFLEDFEKEFGDA